MGNSLIRILVVAGVLLAILAIIYIREGREDNMQRLVGIIMLAIFAAGLVAIIGLVWWLTPDGYMTRFNFDFFGLFTIPGWGAISVIFMWVYHRAESASKEAARANEQITELNRVIGELRSEIDSIERQNRYR
ncbi:hypothetical protein LSB85_003674 [Salmonella enterica]|nr:hypothetical protein [Salmonella enterica]